MSYPLLLFYIDFEIPEHYYAALSTDVLFTTAELPRCHVAFHDIDTVLLIKGDAGNFIKTHNIVLANQTSLASRIIDKHLGHSGLATRNEVGIGRYLLEEVALPCASRA